jgi:tryptophan synthase alpha chain
MTTTISTTTPTPTTPMTTRYEARFAELARNRHGAFVPFVVLGDPDLKTSARILRALVDAGADALEVGVPFSDPIADGPVIQAAATRALAGGASVTSSFELLAELRAACPDIPIGVLTYANLVVNRGRDGFYALAARSGVDSVLVADVPVMEAHPFVAAARAAGVAPVLIAPPNASDDTLSRLAALGAGYTYCVARAGVTGADDDLKLAHGPLFAALKKHGAPPPLLGFGISKPEHVKAALAAGAVGAISGSAIAQRIAERAGDADGIVSTITAFVREMKRSTTG